MSVNDLAALFRAAGDPARLRILALLERGPLCVCQITGGLALAQSSVSKHVGLLRRAGLIEGRRRGRWLICRLSADRHAPPVRDALRRLLKSVRHDPDVLRARRGAARGTLPGVPAECRTCLP